METGSRGSQEYLEGFTWKVTLGLEVCVGTLERSSLEKGQGQGLRNLKGRVSGVFLGHTNLREMEALAFVAAYKCLSRDTGSPGVL